MNRVQCISFLKDPTKNPITNRKITRGGDIYKRLLRECSPFIKFKKVKTKVHLYGEPVFALFYKRKGIDNALEITDFRPDPRNYLKCNKIYKGYLNTYYIDDVSIIHSIEINKKQKTYEFLVVE